MFEFSIEYLNDSNQWTVLHDWTRPIMNKSTLDETHDETQIFLSCSPIEEPFKPFTRFIINITERDNGEIIDTDTLYRVVISDEIEQVRFGAKKLYNHDIRLAEATKELERYVVDNLSFTNAWNKAFQQTFSGAYITDTHLYDSWYNENAVVNMNEPTKGNVSYFINMFTAYNSKDAYIINDVPPIKKTIPIDSTYIARTLYENNTQDNFIFSQRLPTSVLIGNQIVVPSLEATGIMDKKIFKATEVRSVALDYEYNANFEFRRRYGSITLISPSGVETVVDAGQTITLNELGQYKIRYTVTRQVRTKTETTEYLFGRKGTTTTRTYGWYNALRTTLEFELYCVMSGQQTDKLSVYDILSKLIQATPTRYANDTAIKFSLFDDGTEKSIYNRYANIEAPELIITNKNLWEALKEVGGLINAIPYLHIQDKYNWNIIDYMPLSSEQVEADSVETDYCNSTSYYDSENYTSSYDMSIDNMINPISTHEGYINQAGYQISKSIRSEEVEISETSMCIETDYPIYKIDSLKYVNYNLNPPQIELINNVVEEALYNTFVSNTESAGKATCLYYTQGKPNIYGLNYKVSKNTYSAAENKVSIKFLLKTLTDEQFIPTTSDILNGKFIVRYVPYLNARIRIYKPNAPKLKIDTAMFQNQSANVIDARALGRKMVANIGRVGNLGYTDSIKSYHLANVPLKGQRSKDGYFIGTITTEYDRHHLLSSIQYTKDYQKISDYINISNLQRYFEVSEKQSISRYINSHMFYIFGDSIAEINKENGLNQSLNYPRFNYLASLFVDQGYNRKINASILTSYSEENNEEYICSRVYLNSNAIAIGNTINIITDFKDNYGAGYQAVPYMDSGTQAYMNRAVPYSDKFGKIKHTIIQNITDSNIDYSEASTPSTLENNINRLAKSLPAITELITNNNGEIVPTGNDYITISDSYQDNNLPTFSNIGCLQDIDVFKDSREVIHFNQQHHFLVNDTKVILGNAMTEQCRYIQQNEMECRLVFLSDKIDPYEFNIKEADIIEVNTPIEEELQEIAEDLQSLCTKITSSNLENILSTLYNTEELYILPNIQHDGRIVGLSTPAQAWAIITDKNELIIGKNEYISTDNFDENSYATQINMSITSKF